MICEEKERAFTEPKGSDSSAKTRDIPDLPGPQDLGIVVNVFLDIRGSHVVISETTEWRIGRDGEGNFASGLGMRPRDLARIGQMLLDDGKIGERQIVPAAWLKDSIMWRNMRIIILAITPRIGGRTRTVASRVMTPMSKGQV